MSLTWKNEFEDELLQVLWTKVTLKQLEQVTKVRALYKNNRGKEGTQTKQKTLYINMKFLKYEKKNL